MVTLNLVASLLLVAVPRILEVILFPHELRGLGARIKEMKVRFPQVTSHIILRHFPTNHLFDLFFSLFNNSNLSEESQKGEDNRCIFFYSIIGGFD